jgi:hypothetical protein
LSDRYSSIFGRKLAISSGFDIKSLENILEIGGVVKNILIA